MDERLGIEKQHTPARQYFLASFTGRDPYGEGRAKYAKHFPRWRQKSFGDRVAAFLAELKGIRDTLTGSTRDIVRGKMKYFDANKDRMHYDRSIPMHLPIGSGSIQSGCRGVIGARMKRSGMTWSPL